MTQPNQTSTTAQIPGDGVNNDFTYLFEIPTTAESGMIYIPESGDPVELTHSTHYTITVGAESGGTATLVSLPTSETLPIGVNQSVVIYRKPLHTQDQPLRRTRTFDPDQIEEAFDKETRTGQDLARDIARSFQYPAAEPGMSGVIPSAASRANTIDAWDASGNRTQLPTSGATDVRSDYYYITDYGADATGVADSAAGIQAAVSAASPSGTVVVPPGRFKFLDSGAGYVTVPTNVRIVGDRGASIIDTASLTIPQVDGVFRAEGTFATDANWALSINMDEGDADCIVTDSSGLAAGDLVMVVSDTLIGDTQQIQQAYLSYIHSISGPTLTLTSAAQWDYTTAANAEVRLITPVSDIHIEGLRFESQGRHATLPGDRSIFIKYGERITVERCDFYRVDFTSVAIQNSHTFGIDNCTVYIDPKGASAQVQYGMRVENASCRGAVAGCTIDGGRHALNTGGSVSELVGMPRDVTFSGNWLTNNWLSAIATHEWAYNINFVGNVIQNGVGGIDLRQRRMTVKDNWIEYISGIGIELGEYVSEMEITNNRLRHIGGRGIQLTESADSIAGTQCRINGNRFLDVGTSDTDYAIMWNVTTDATAREALEICDNSVYGCTSSAIYVNGSFVGGRISGNYAQNLTGSGKAAFRLNGIQNFQVHGNAAVGTMSYGVWIGDAITISHLGGGNNVQGNFVADINVAHTGTPHIDNSTGAHSWWRDNKADAEYLLWTIASAGTMTLPVEDDFIRVTGAVTIANITGTLRGDVKTLIFTTGGGILDHGAGNLRLNGTTDWNPVPSNSIITLRFDGTNWVEQSRSAN